MTLSDQWLGRPSLPPQKHGWTAPESFTDTDFKRGFERVAMSCEFTDTEMPAAEFKAITSRARAQALGILRHGMGAMRHHPQSHTAIDSG